MSDLVELEKRIKALEDIEEIRKTKSRYWRFIDKKAWDVIGDVFAEDVTADYGEGGIIQGRTVLVDFIKKYEGYDFVVTTHQGHQSEIELTGDNTALGTFAFSYYRADQQAKTVRRDGIFYEDEFVKAKDGQWRIRRLKVIPLRSEVSQTSCQDSF